MLKQKLLFAQARLNNRGVSEMVLLHISASKGVPSDMVNNFQSKYFQTRSFAQHKLILFYRCFVGYDNIRIGHCNIAWW